MSLHRTDLVFMGCRVWLEPNENPVLPPNIKPSAECVQWQAEHSASQLYRMLHAAAGPYYVKDYAERKELHGKDKP